MFSFESVMIFCLLEEINVRCIYDQIVTLMVLSILTAAVFGTHVLGQSMLGLFVDTFPFGRRHAKVRNNESETQEKYRKITSRLMCAVFGMVRARARARARGVSKVGCPGLCNSSSSSSYYYNQHL